MEAVLKINIGIKRLQHFIQMCCKYLRLEYKLINTFIGTIRENLPEKLEKTFKFNKIEKKKIFYVGSPFPNTIIISAGNGLHYCQSPAVALQFSLPRSSDGFHSAFRSSISPRSCWSIITLFMVGFLAHVACTAKWERTVSPSQ